MVSKSFKPKFWHPDADRPGLNEERKSAFENESSSFVFNSYTYLSLDQQRQKLPIFKNRNDILYMLEKYQTIIIVGETGSGKSTQIPQYLIESGWGDDGKIVAITQPRRVAATTLASRVAEEKGTVLGETVGYSIRFDDRFNAETTKIKFLTEGILVREMMADPLLRNYSVVMVDEAHERTIFTDLLLGLLKKILRKRRDLRLIVSSATLEAEKMKDFFNLNEAGDDDTCSILSIEGRLHPIEIYYLDEPVPNYVNACVDTAIKIHRYEGENRGDILIFLTGQEEVDRCVTMLIDYACEMKNKADKTTLKLLILPMYGSLPNSDQLKVFKPTPKGVRKVVVATNIAEASVTIPGIVYVIDCGFVKLKYFNSNTCNDSLIIVPVSKASAIQRAGRAGRIRPGKVYRLFPEEEFNNLVESTPPELTRSSLANTVLQLKALGVDNILRFDFISPPPAKNMIHALELLYALDALDGRGRLTDPIGIRMAEFPLHPMFAKMILSSVDFGCTEEILRISAMLQVQNIFVTPYGNAAIQARRAKHLFSVSEGDHLTLLNVYGSFMQNNNRSWCDKHYLNYRGLTRAVEIRSQLEKLLKKFNIKSVSCDGDTDVVCRCIVSGFFSNAAYLHHSGVYKTIKGDHTVYIHPSSVLYTEKQPQWLVYGEILHTSQEYIRDVTVVEPSWLYELAPHYYRYGDNESRKANTLP